MCGGLRWPLFGVRLICNQPHALRGADYVSAAIFLLLFPNYVLLFQTVLLKSFKVTFWDFATLCIS